MEEGGYGRMRDCDSRRNEGNKEWKEGKHEGRIRKDGMEEEALKGGV